MIPTPKSFFKPVGKSVGCFDDTFASTPPNPVVEIFRNVVGQRHLGQEPDVFEPTPSIEERFELGSTILLNKKGKKTLGILQTVLFVYEVDPV